MRACHIQLNNWATAHHLEDNVLYNVRIRGVVAGVQWPFGPACRMMIDPTVADCPPTGLNNIAGHANLSCGVARVWGGPNSAANRVHARSIAVEIHDLSGKRVVAREVPAQRGAIGMDLEGEIATGTYVVTITAGDQRHVELLVIVNRN